MNLFLPYPDDLVATARFLDDGRLNKQVVEAYQVGRVSVRRITEPEAKIGWKNHPSSLLVYNDGVPKLPWLKAYIRALDEEWVWRGFRRSEEFGLKISALFTESETLEIRLSSEAVCAFVGGGETIHGDSELVGRLYREYLDRKYELQTRPPRWTRRGRP